MDYIICMRIEEIMSFHDQYEREALTRTPTQVQADKNEKVNGSTEKIQHKFSSIGSSPDLIHLKHSNVSDCREGCLSARDVYVTTTNR